MFFCISKFKHCIQERDYQKREKEGCVLTEGIQNESSLSSGLTTFHAALSFFH